MSLKKEFIVHHVGGRSGIISFPLSQKFIDDVSLVIYDADESACGQIKNKWPKAIVSPTALSSEKAIRTFNINVIPSSNSLFPLNPKESNGMNELGRTDVDFKSCFAPVEKVTLETEALDELVLSSAIPAPNWLGLDVQGAELSILEGAKSVLSDSVVALDVEVNFRTLYEQAPLFGELDGFLTERGFVLADLSLISSSLTRSPFIARGSQLPVQGNALYLLDPSSLNFVDDKVKVPKLLNLAFASCCVGHTEITYDALVKAGVIQRLIDAEPVSNIKSFIEQYLSSNIAKFLVEFAMLCITHSEYPPLWSDAIGHKRARLGPTQVKGIKHYFYKFTAVCSNFREFKLYLASKKMERFLRENGLCISAEKVKLRRKQFLSHIPADLYYSKL